RSSSSYACSCSADTETGDASLGSCRTAAPGGSRDCAQSSCDTTRRDHPGSGFTADKCTTTCDPRSAACYDSSSAGRKCSASGAASDAASGADQRYADASCATRKASGPDCTAAANDHAADRPAPGVQSASACAGCGFAICAGATGAGAAN